MGAVGFSRQEINLRRLLAKCELMCKNQKDDQRFEQYVDTLEDMVQEIKKNSSTSVESIKNYQKRVLNIKKTLGITTISKYEEFNDPILMRNDLLGLKHRNSTSSSQIKLDSGNLEEVLKHQEELQTKIAEGMLEYTKTLKEQSEVANKIIKQDTEVVGNSTDLTDKNYSKLMEESSKLAEHSRKAWRCWMWLMLVFVLIVFLFMVLFMKVMKKTKK